MNTTNDPAKWAMYALMDVGARFKFDGTDELYPWVITNAAGRQFRVSEEAFHELGQWWHALTEINQLPPTQPTMFDVHTAGVIA